MLKSKESRRYISGYFKSKSRGNPDGEDIHGESSTTEKETAQAGGRRKRAKSSQAIWRKGPTGTN
jgi:hypothetical protein